MTKPTPQALAAAVKALYRIRAVEGPPGEQGQRTVWHQCALGAELVSTVDGLGHLVRQELTLIHSYFLWTPERGVLTGRVVEDGPRALANAGPVVELDAQPDLERLREALTALAEYPGDDRYIHHILDGLARARDGAPPDQDEITVTTVPPPELLAAPASGPDRRRWVFAAVTIAAALAAAAATAMLQ
ncbi:MAG TPA: hypothetical protein VND93_27725 [Myxococcales bacterium]|nr:hypothetical protein [Myxococcales bacterium]